LVEKGRPKIRMGGGEVLKGSKKLIEEAQHVGEHVEIDELEIT